MKKINFKGAESLYKAAMTQFNVAKVVLFQDGTKTFYFDDNFQFLGSTEGKGISDKNAISIVNRLYKPTEQSEKYFENLYYILSKSLKTKGLEFKNLNIIAGTERESIREHLFQPNLVDYVGFVKFCKEYKPKKKVNQTQERLGDVPGFEKLKNLFK